MIRYLLNYFYSIKFYFGVLFSKVTTSKRGFFGVRNKQTAKQLFEKKQRERYLFHANLKAGDHYSLGQATVTLATFGVAGKLEVAKKIEAANLRREKRKTALTKQAEEIMLLSPEELLKFNLENWFEERKRFLEITKKFPLMTKDELKKQLKAEALPPDGKTP